MSIGLMSISDTWPRSESPQKLPGDSVPKTGGKDKTVGVKRCAADPFVSIKLRIHKSGSCSFEEGRDMAIVHHLTWRSTVRTQSLPTMTASGTCRSTRIVRRCGRLQARRVNPYTLHRRQLRNSRQSCFKSTFDCFRSTVCNSKRIHGQLADSQ